MKKITCIVFSTASLMSYASNDIKVSDYYNSSETINGVSYPRIQNIEALANIDNNSLEELVKGLIGTRPKYLKSSVLRHTELALSGERYRFYDDIYDEIKALDLEDKIDTLKPTLNKTSDIELEALNLLNSSLDLSNSQLIKTNYLTKKNEHSSYITLRSTGELSADRYNNLIGFDNVKATIDADYYNIKQSILNTDIGVIKFFKLDLNNASYIKLNLNKIDYTIEKYNDEILEVKSNGKVLNYICAESCPAMLEAQVDLDISMPTKLSQIVMNSTLHSFKKENKYKDLSNKELVTQLLSTESYKVIQTFSAPTKENISNLEYKFSEIALNPKEALYFEVPENFSTMSVSGITIGHRQNERATTTDRNPGYTAVAVYTKDMPSDKAWRYWGGHASGAQGAKFAEQRSRAEIDTLYEWPRLGHKSVNDNSESNQIIKANTIRVRNVGRDEIRIDSISLKTIFLEKMQFDDYIFTQGSDFGDSKTFKNRYYAGGQVKRGTFPNALRLHKRSRSPHTSNFPPTWVYDSERIFIPLNNINLATIEVMAGDTHPDKVRNKDGGWGSLGDARLSVGIADNTDPDYDTQVQWLSDEDNIGPQGVTPISVDKIKNINAKYLILKNSRSGSALYIMGIRIGHQKNQGINE